MTKSEKEEVFIKTALGDPEFRALAITVGALLPFSKPMRSAIMNLVKAKLEESETTE